MTERHLELTRNTIESLGDGIRLIIIDDASQCGGGYLRSEADIYIRNRTNLGYAASVNRGLRLADSQYIAISNNDVRISSNWKEVSDEVFKSDEGIYSCHFRMTDYDVPFEYGDKVITSGKERWCHASFFVINKRFGLFFYDEHFFNTYDDWDYFQSVRESGFRQAYTDKAQFQHIHSATIPTMVKHTERNEENKEYFKSKWGDYAENLFAAKFPDQMIINYPDGFKL